MAIKGISSHSSGAYISRLNAKLSELHVQLATGKKSQTYGHMGNNRNIALRMRADIQNYYNYNQVIDRANIHLGSLQNVLTSLRDIQSNARADFNGTAMALHDGSFRQVKIGTEQRLSDAISLMNEKIAGRYLFSGANLESKPVEDLDKILNGEGAKAGLKQYISERKLADLGSLNNGRLTIGLAGNQVNITEDGVHVFGLKLKNITQNIAGVSTTGPVGAPAALGVDFTGAAPLVDDEIVIQVTLPDGVDVNIIIKAKTSGVSDKDGFVIGGSDVDNATNFQTALNDALAFLANGEMMAGSAVQAGEEFFGEPPQRVDGPPFDTATAMKTGTITDTMSWYNGDKTPGAARDSYKIFASKNSTLSVGVRADEEPMRDFIKNMAIMVAETFDPDSAESNAHYGALKTRLTAGLSDNTSKVGILDLSTELGYKEKHLDNLSIRNASRVYMSENVLSDIEESDTYEVSAQLMALNTQLEISYKTTSILSQVHLVNFM